MTVLEIVNPFVYFAGPNATVCVADAPAAPFAPGDPGGAGGPCLSHCTVVSPAAQLPAALYVRVLPLAGVTTNQPAGPEAT